jgi:hypothetical protein
MSCGNHSAGIDETTMLSLSSSSIKDISLSRQASGLFPSDFQPDSDSLKYFDRYTEQ